MKTRDSSGTEYMVCRAAKTSSERIVPGEFWCAYGITPVSFAMSVSVTGRPVSPQGSSASLQKYEQPVGKARHRGVLPKPQSPKSGAHALKAVSTMHAACSILIVVMLVFVLPMGLVPFLAPAINTSVPTELISVSQGDTLWSIAVEHPIEGMTTQQCVRWISSINNLNGSILIPGQAIEVAKSVSL